MLLTVLQVQLCSALFAKMKFLLALLIFVPVVMSGHDGHKVYFTFSAGENAIDVEVRLDQEEFTEELRKHSVCTEEMDQLVCSLNYIKKNLVVSINGNEVDLQFVSTTTIDDTMVLLFGIVLDPAHMRSINIHNTCFAFSSHSTSNIMRFLFNEDVTYKMDRQRVDLYHEF